MSAALADCLGDSQADRIVFEYVLRRQSFQRLIASLCSGSTRNLGVSLSEPSRAQIELTLIGILEGAEEIFNPSAICHLAAFLEGFIVCSLDQQGSAVSQADSTELRGRLRMGETPDQDNQEPATTKENSEAFQEASGGT